MRALARPNGWSLALLSLGLLAPRAARAQAAAETSPPPPGYQQYPQQPPAQPQPYPQQYQQPQPYQYPQQYQQPPGQPQPGQPQPYPQQYQQPPAYPPPYQSPGSYPQPGQPPPAYPPQQYPQQQYPQQYPQPQAYPQQPGYYQAQPAYPAAPEPVQAPRHRGLMMLPYLGFNSPVGAGSDGYSAGFRLGGLIGGYVGSNFSINGELSIDVMSFDTPPGYDDSEVLAAVTLSPLFHFGPPRMDFVIGPRLGYFADVATRSVSGSSTKTTYSMNGVAYGFNTGVFFSLGRIWLGGLLSFTAHSPSEQCVDQGYGEECGDPLDKTAFKVLTMNGAVLF